jgi:hypothetical protein
LIPIVLSLALDYCMPAATAYLSEYAGGAIAAGLLSGIVSGYNDPLSSVFDSVTYTLGDTDITSFVCNRAGMLLGTVLACKPTSVASSGIKAVTNVAAREVVGAAVAKTEIAIAKTVTTSLKQGAKTTAQKTAQAAEQYVAKIGTPSLDSLSKAGQVLDRNGLTRAGRALQKHGDRVGSVFPRISGSPANKNVQGQFHLDDILTHPKSVIERYNRPRYGGDVIDIKIPGNRGVRYSKDGEFIGFLNP